MNNLINISNIVAPIGYSKYPCVLLVHLYLFILIAEPGAVVSPRVIVVLTALPAGSLYLDYT